ncbi:MBL fold metallo-hydrolase [soil metagenome]
MPVSFTVLASGSGGNASVLEVDGFRVLIDCGLGPRQLIARLCSIGLNWPDLSAVVLTHTHGDHWREANFKQFQKYRIPFFCHLHHARLLQREASSFGALHQSGLVRNYANAIAIDFGSGFVCWPIPISHDGGPTFGFRFSIRRADGSAPMAVAFLTDLGHWTPELAKLVTDVDLLALEFNHDVEMEISSGRSGYLVERVIGKNGHLSNEQAALLVKEILTRSSPGRLQHLVQLHLSRDCNHPDLAVSSVRAILDGAGHPITLVTADQDLATVRLHVTPRPCAGESKADSQNVTENLAMPFAATRKRSPRYSSVQPMLPGF